MEPSGLEPLTPACHAGALPAELWPQISKSHSYQSIYRFQGKFNLISIVLYGF